ncbi:MAG: hypothetical protein FWF02_08015 [Micrococcales bacterium]|nr:hypothetical protein [Micrococcales bacterium]
MTKRLQEIYRSLVEDAEYSKLDGIDKRAESLAEFCGVKEELLWTGKSRLCPLDLRVLVLTHSKQRNGILVGIKGLGPHESMPYYSWSRAGFHFRYLNPSGGTGYCDVPTWPLMAKPDATVEVFLRGCRPTNPLFAAKLMQDDPPGQGKYLRSELGESEEFSRFVEALSCCTGDRDRTWQELVVGAGGKIGPALGAGTLLSGECLSLMYRVPGFSRWIFITPSENFGTGMSIAAMTIAPSMHVTIAPSGITRCVSRHLERLEEIDYSMLPNPDCIQKSQAPDLGVLGHDNFAHSYLQCLPAFERISRLERTVSFAEATVELSARNPLGDVTKIVPGLPPLCKDAELRRSDCGASGLAFSERLILPLGVGVDNQRKAMKISTSLRHLVIAHATRSGDPPPLVDTIANAGHDFVLWVSIRGIVPRTPSNFEDVVVSLAKILDVVRSGPALVLDGMSLQWGWEERSFLKGHRLDEYFDAELRIASSIEDRISSDGLSTAVYPAIGMKMAESIQLASTVDAYFTHDGTTQHKIGWFYPELPGIVHGPRQRSSSAQFGWHPVEGGVAPVYVPSELIIDDPSIDSWVPQANYGYSVLLNDQWVDFVRKFADLVQSRRVLQERLTRLARVM